MFIFIEIYYSLCYISCHNDLIAHWKKLLAENGDKLVGKWKASQSGTEIDCERSDTVNNAYMCTYNGYQAPVTWKRDFFIWDYGSTIGIITIESDKYTQRLTWNTGSVWRKNMGKFVLIYGGFGIIM